MVMGATPYVRGVRFEYRVRNHLSSRGYIVLRSPRSGGPIDLVAIRSGEVLFIQCKTSKHNMTRRETDELIELARSVNAKPILAYRDPKPPYKIRLENLYDVGGG